MSRRLPPGWRVHALGSTYPSGNIVPDHLTCVARNGASFTCIARRGGERFAEFAVQAPSPINSYVPRQEWDQVRAYARRRLRRELGYCEKD